MRAMAIVMAICLILAVPADLQAAKASKEFPDLQITDCDPDANIPGGDYGQVNLKLKWKLSGGGGGGPTQLAYTHDYLQADGGCQVGKQVAADLMKGLCNDCITKPDCDVLSGLFGGGFCVGQLCCDNVDPELSNTINLKSSNGLATLTKLSGEFEVEVSDNLANPAAIPPIPGSELTNFLHSTNAGNAVGTDLRPKFTIVVARAGGEDGDVTVTIDRVSPPRETFSFPTAGRHDLGILKGLQDGFAGRGIASTMVENRGLTGHTEAPESYYGQALAVTLPANVLVVTVQAPRGFVNQVDTSTIPGPARTPALSTWGVAALIGLMLLAGAWILRRTTTMRVNPS